MERHFDEPTKSKVHAQPCAVIMDLLDVDVVHIDRRRVLGNLKTVEKVAGPVLYWMSRDQRVQGVILWL